MQGLLLAGRYRLGESIGRGGMGRVWRAHDELLHRTVAVKELTAAQYASDSDRSVLLARTQTEARAAARVNHPAVVTIHDVLEHDERPWIVMELIEGGSLADVLNESGPLDAQYAARVGLWVLRALRAAHAAGVLHRDVKPGNVLLARDGRVLLTDFGIAQVEGDTTLTRTGEVVGSVDYLAPERVRGADPGPACDLWALGATLYTAVDGRSPFRRSTPLNTMQAVVEEEVAEPSGAGPLGPVISALLRKDPALRPGVADIETMLVEAVEGRKPAAAQEYLSTTAHPFDATRSHDDWAGHQPPGPAPATPPGHPYGPPQQGAYEGAYADPARRPHGAPPGLNPAGLNTYGPEPGGGYDPAQPGGPGPAPHEPPYDAFEGSATRASRRQGPAPGGEPADWRATVPGGRGPGESATPMRRWGRVLAAVLAAAALLAGGTMVGLRYANGQHAEASTTDEPAPAGSSDPSDPSGTSPTTPPGTSSRQHTGAKPKGWIRVHDVAGFSVLLPQGWVRETSGTQIDYTPDQDNHFVRISIDRSPDWDDPFLHQKDLERQLSDLPDYRRVNLISNTFRDRPGSVWEFSWTAVPDDPFPGPRHAMEETYIDPDGVEYVIYMSSPASDWKTTRRQFDVVLRGWQPDEQGAEDGGGEGEQGTEDGSGVSQ